MSPRAVPPPEPSAKITGVLPLRPVLGVGRNGNSFVDTVEVGAGVFVSLLQLRSLGFDVHRYDGPPPLAEVDNVRALRKRAVAAELLAATRDEELKVATRAIQRRRDDGTAALEALRRDRDRRDRIIEALRLAVEAAYQVTPEHATVDAELDAVDAAQRMAMLLAAADDPCMVVLVDWLPDLDDDEEVRRVERRCVSYAGHDDNHVDRHGETFTDADVMRAEQ